MNQSPSKIRARDGPIMLDWFKLYQHTVSFERWGNHLFFILLLATKKATD